MVAGALVASGVAGAAPPAPSTPIELVLDAREAPRRMVHATLTIPVRPGPLALVHPRWAIPTYEAPATVLDDIVGLTLEAGGRALPWRRDPVDLFTIRTTVPAGARTLTVALDVIVPEERSDLNAATGQLFVVDWQTVLYYPRGTLATGTPVHVRLMLPGGWRARSALTGRVAPDGSLDFDPVTFAELVDSPVQAGRHVASVSLDAPGPPVTVDVAADTADGAVVPPEWRERIRRIVAEAGALFGGYPYRRFHFLLSLGDSLGNDGLEHRESADIRLRLAGLRGEPNRRAYGYLIPHEYVHAWNGKLAVPAGVLRSDFETPQDTELLWVYEGLTRYLNWVLAARAGVLTPEESRDYLALLAARLAHQSGRAWRSMQDTATSGRILNDAPDAWESLRRSTDYYDEGLLVWLEVDATLRRLTGGRRSMDDFCRAFLGSPAPPPGQRAYAFEDVVSTLHALAPHDWRALLRARLDAVGAPPPLRGLEASGWTLAYGPSVNAVQAARDGVRGTVEERFSVGLLLSENGTVVDVVRDSPAWRAGLGPGMRVATVGGGPWSPDAFRRAVAGSSSTGGVALEVRNGAGPAPVRIEYHGGARYPRLERNAAPDALAAVLAPRT